MGVPQHQVVISPLCQDLIPAGRHHLHLQLAQHQLLCCVIHDLSTIAINTSIQQNDFNITVFCSCCLTKSRPAQHNIQMHKKVMISTVKLSIKCIRFPIMDKTVSFQIQLVNGTCIRAKHLQTGQRLLIALIRLFAI